MNRNRKTGTKARPCAEVAVRHIGEGIMKGKERSRLGLALLWLGIGVVSLFVSVVSYTPPGGDKTTYAIQELLCRGWFLPPNTYDCGSFVVNGTAVVGKEPKKAL